MSRSLRESVWHSKLSNNNNISVSEGIYDTSSNDTSSTEPFRRKGFLSKCHFVECPLRRNRVSS